MSRYAGRHWCGHESCPTCSDMAAAAWVEREFPERLSRGEEARRDNAYEQAMWGDQ